MKDVKSNSGLTLIEIIISVAILSIVTLILLSVFATGLFHINNAGKDAVDLFGYQTDMEELVASEVGKGDQISMTFYDSGTTNVLGEGEFTVEGTIVEMDNLISFLPSSTNGTPPVPDTGSDATLTEILVNGIDIFKPNVDHYTKVDYTGNENLKPLQIQVVPSDSIANTDISYPVNFDLESNIKGNRKVNIIVTAQDGTERPYSIEFNKK